MAKAYVFSTLACDQAYTEWNASGADLKVKGRSVLIKGGTGVANDRIVTPLGVMTEVEEEDIAFLKANPAFKQHMDNGFVRIQTKSADPEKVAADMQMNDKSAPLTPQSPEMQNAVETAE